MSSYPNIQPKSCQFLQLMVEFNFLVASIEYIAVEHGLAKEMVSNAASKKNLEDAFDGKLEMVPIKRNPIHAELHDVHDLTPLTPTFQYSE